MNRTWLFTLFGLTALVHLAIPYSQIHQQESVLKNGREILVRTRPVDPYDIFRGRYVALGFTQNQITNHQRFVRGSKVYAQYTQDKDGFITITGVTETPKSSDDLRVKIQYSGNGNTAIQYPFDRFYMNEKEAPQAEKAYRTLNREGVSNTWVKVKVLNNHAVLEDLILDGMPASEYLKAQPEK